MSIEEGTSLRISKLNSLQLSNEKIEEPKKDLTWREKIKEIGSKVRDYNKASDKECVECELVILERLEKKYDHIHCKHCNTNSHLLDDD